MLLSKILISSMAAAAAIGASMQTSNPAFILKAINDEIKANGNDWQYELNAKGKLLQQMYEEMHLVGKHPEKYITH